MKKASIMVLLSAVGAIVLNGCSGSPPTDLAVKDGKLKPCPSSPNCVSSFESDAEHGIQPIKYTTNKVEAYLKLLQILKSEERVSVVTKSEDYIRVEFKTFLMRYVDDVEFLFDKNQTIHFRSASRLGHSDLGLNRKRMERIKKRFQNE